MLRILLMLMTFISFVAHATGIRELSWDDLVPPSAPRAAPQMAPLHDLAQMGTTLAESAPAAHQQAPRAPVVAALNGQQVRMPGFIVPLETSEEGRTTEFLLVPYYGACIHVPPPPSNQIVQVTSELGVKMEDLYQPFWVEGSMQVKPSTSELAEAGYQMVAQKIYVYELPD